MSLPFTHITLVGIGLIGSSLARAIWRLDPLLPVHIVDTSESALETAKRLALGQSWAQDVTEPLASDLVILCVPVGAMEAVLHRISPHLAPGTLVSDVGSVKGVVQTLMTDMLPEAVIAIPAHPVAGTEESGPEAGFAGLFDNRWCILTPPPIETAAIKAALERLTRFWEALGARVDVMTADHHDRVLAITSHVPHLIAYTIVGTAADLETVTQSEVISFSAGGFRDFTRIAASDPTMWRDVFLANKGAVLEMLGRFQEDVSILARAIRWDDGDALFDLFTRTRGIRRDIIDAGQDVGRADFGRFGEALPGSLPGSLPGPLPGSSSD